MPHVLSVSPPSPARVHQRARELCGHHPFWDRIKYRGGIWHREHYRCCSYCGCIHPQDLADLIAEGRSWLEAARRPGKLILWTPNPVAGELVRMGSYPGPIFDHGAEPRSLIERLRAPPAANLPFEPSPGERAACHWERPMLEPAPAMIGQPIYSEHTNQPQWAEIEAAAAKRSDHDPSIPSA